MYFDNSSVSGGSAQLGSTLELFEPATDEVAETHRANRLGVLGVGLVATVEPSYSQWCLHR